VLFSRAAGYKLRRERRFYHKRPGKKQAFWRACISEFWRVRRPGAGGDPQDFAGTAVFLASSASAFVTGTAIPVDGGYSVLT
jgi:NAD(P)-dependent dehydrogenase (short-subunit alcohol dehydrogenase family)